MTDPKRQAPPRQRAQNYHQNPSPQQGHYTPSHPRFGKKPSNIFTPLIETRMKLFDQLNATVIIHPVSPKLVDTSSQFYQADRMCAYITPTLLGMILKIVSI